MSTYQYKAREKTGKLIEGTMSAETEDAVVQELKHLGHIPISIICSQKNDSRLALKLPLIFRKIRYADLNFFTRQFYTCQKAGLPLLSSLQALKQQTNQQTLKETIDFMARDIEAGSTLSQAMSQRPEVFGPLYVSMIKTGEASGKLVEILDRLATLGEHEDKIRMRIKAAMRYPFIVVSSLVLGFTILVMFVMPRFVKIFSDFKTELPLPTRVLIGIHTAVSQYWWLLIIIATALFFLFKTALQSELGQRLWDRVLLKIPIFGPLISNLILSRFCRITAILIESGVPILQIMDLVAENSGNTLVSQVILRIKQSLNEGKTMSGPMKESLFFPPMIVQMVSVGEQTGRLSELLIQVSDYYDSQIDYTINNLVSLIEPILILVLGCMVLFMALGIFLPMWGLMDLYTKI